MAPNRKSIAALTATLSSTDLQSLQTSVATSKFLPLTDPKEALQQAQPPKQQTVVVAENSASYWDWQSTAPVEPAETFDILSLANIEANLVKTAEEYKTESASKQVAAHDNYWAEEQQQAEPEERPVVKQAQHIETSYWEWPAEQDYKRATIESILREEKAYHLVSGAAVELREAGAKGVSKEIIQTDATKVSNDGYWGWESPVVAPHTDDVSHPNRNYWDWSEETMKKNPHQDLLDYEAARQLVMADSIVKSLVNQKNVPTSGGSPNGCSDEYWQWSDRLGDAYWDVPATAPQVTTADAQSYWEW